MDPLFINPETGALQCTNADLTLAHDPLLSLVMIRRCVTEQLNIEAMTFEAIEHNAFRIQNVPQEDTKRELDLIMMSDFVCHAFQMIRETGMFHYVFPLFRWESHEQFVEEMEKLSATPKQLDTRWEMFYNGFKIRT